MGWYRCVHLQETIFFLTKKYTMTWLVFGVKSCHIISRVLMFLGGHILPRWLVLGCSSPKFCWFNPHSSVISSYRVISYPVLSLFHHACSLIVCPVFVLWITFFVGWIMVLVCFSTLLGTPVSLVALDLWDVCFSTCSCAWLPGWWWSGRCSCGCLVLRMVRFG